MAERRARRLAAVLALTALTACATRAPEPELLRRHATLSRAEAPGRVAVTVHAAPLPPEAGETRLLQLSRSAQPELIESLAAKTTSVEDFLAALAAPAATAADPAGLDDRTRVRRRIVVSAESRDPGPADRITRLRVVLSLDTTEARFWSWDRYASDHGTVDVGQLALRREAESDLDVRVGAGPRLLDRALVRAGGTVRLDEELPISDRYLSTGILLPDSMVLLQRGAAGVDLAGNSVLAVELRVRGLPPTTVHRFDGLFDADGRAATPDRVRVGERTLRVARPLPGGLVARLRYEAVSRAVAPGAGDATFAEGDDRARHLRTVGAVRTVTLVPAGELRASAWELVDAGCRDVVHVRAPGSARPAALRLGSWEDADRLARWLAVTGASRVGGRELLLGAEALVDAARARGLRVRLLPLNWQPGVADRCS